MSISSWYRGSWRTQAADRGIFDLEEAFDAVFRSLPADAGLLHTAERSHLGGDDALIDADDAVFQIFHDAEDAADIARIEIGGKPVFGVVRHADGVRILLKAEQGDDGSEDFLARHRHVGCDIAHNGGLEEGAAQGVALAAEGDGGALACRLADQLLDFFHGRYIDQRSLFDARHHAVAYSQRGDRLC